MKVVEITIPNVPAPVAVETTTYFETAVQGTTPMVEKIDLDGRLDYVLDYLMVEDTIEDEQVEIEPKTTEEVERNHTHTFQKSMGNFAQKIHTEIISESIPTIVY